MKLQQYKKILLPLLAILLVIAFYLFFTLTDALLFWIDVAVIASCIFFGQKLLKKNLTLAPSLSSFKRLYGKIKSLFL